MVTRVRGMKDSVRRSSRATRWGELASAVALIACLSVWTSEASADPATARDILEAAGVKGGLVVHLGCGDGKLTAGLCATDSYLVHGLDTDAANVEAARKHIRSQGLYGRVSVERLPGKRLPYADNLVNLVVAEGLGPGAPGMDEVMRVLCPNGVVVVRSAAVRRSGADALTGTLRTKPRPKEIDEWTHYLRDAGGNPVAQDTVVAPPRRLQWAGSPRWARHHDHMASMTSLVSANGRLFYIFDEGPAASIQLPSQWRLIARDAFNGTVLWKRKIDRWNTRQWPLKSGPAHLTRRLAAVGGRVYVTLGLEAPLTALDAASGQTVLTYPGSERTREILVPDGMVVALVGLEPSRLPEWRRRHTYVWDNSSP